jgi:hypothetical protein
MVEASASRIARLQKLVPVLADKEAKLDNSLFRLPEA